MSRLTRTVNLYPAGTLIVGCTFKFRLVIWAPVWVSSWPTALPAVWAGVGYPKQQDSSSGDGTRNDSTRSLPAGWRLERMARTLSESFG
jgi:hypothetical protein